MKRFLRYCIMLCLVAMPSQAAQLQGERESKATSKKQQDYVIVLHGVARSSSSMSEVAEKIAAEGYEVFNLDYPSTDFSFEELREILREKIQALHLDQKRKVHFVGYSMGSLMIRLYLEKYRPENLGRVVMLAPPNKGSEAADFFKNDPLFKYIFGQAGQTLGVKEDGIAAHLPPADFDLGIIAGDRSIDPISSAIIPGVDDGKVSIEASKMEGMKDHIVLHVTHTFIITNDEAIQQAIYYLKEGRFKR